MADSQYDTFLQEATTADPASDRALGRSRLYGLYTSWCFLNQAAPQPEGTFWAAMNKKQIHPRGPGRRQKGPPAADSIRAHHPGPL